MTYIKGLETILCGLYMGPFMSPFREHRVQSVFMLFQGLQINSVPYAAPDFSMGNVPQYQASSPEVEDSILKGYLMDIITIGF